MILPFEQAIETKVLKGKKKTLLENIVVKTHMSIILMFSTTLHILIHMLKDLGKKLDTKKTINFYFQMFFKIKNIQYLWDIEESRSLLKHP
jgi:hypothetical protein